MDRTEDRLEEAARNVNEYGKVFVQDYANQIDLINQELIQKAVEVALKTKPTFVAIGGGAHRLPSYDQI